MNDEETKLCDNCKREIPIQNHMVHQVHCNRNFKVCPVCKEPVPISELQDHHDKMHKMLPCKFCGESVCGTDMEDHIRDSCGHTMKTCRFCEIELPRKNMPVHETYCGCRTEQCKDCKEWVMAKYRQIHLDSNHNFTRLEEDPKPIPASRQQNTLLPWFNKALSSGPRTIIRFKDNFGGESSTSGTGNQIIPIPYVSEVSDAPKTTSDLILVPRKKHHSSKNPKPGPSTSSSNPPHSNIPHFESSDESWEDYSPDNSPLSSNRPSKSPQNSNKSNSSVPYNPNIPSTSQNSNNSARSVLPNSDNFEIPGSLHGKVSKPFLSTNDANPSSSGSQNSNRPTSPSTSNARNSSNQSLSSNAKNSSSHPRKSNSPSVSQSPNTKNSNSPTSPYISPNSRNSSNQSSSSSDFCVNAPSNTSGSSFSNDDSTRISPGVSKMSRDIKKHKDGAGTSKAGSSRGAVKKRAAPRPPPPADPRRDMAYYSALSRKTQEDNKRREENERNLALGLPPVLSPAAKLEKLRKMDSLLNPPEDPMAHKKVLNDRVWGPIDMREEGHLLGSWPQNGNQLNNLKPMSEQEFQDRFRVMQAEGEDGDRPRTDTRFNDIKWSLRELRRGLNEVTAVYNTNNGGDNTTPVSPASSNNEASGMSVNPEAVALPCEFCGTSYPADELILHQTGCRPDLARYETSANMYDEEPVIPCEFCTESLPVHLYAEHQNNCSGLSRRVTSLLFPD